MDSATKNASTEVTSTLNRSLMDSASFGKQDSREYLEWQYSPSQWNRRMSPNDVVEHCIQTTNQASEKARTFLTGQLNIPYGQNKAQMDIFEPRGHASGIKEKGINPVMIYIHGGYWTMCSKNEYSHVAVPITNAGGIAAIVGYNQAPSVTMDEIVSDIKSAVEFVAEMYPDSSLFLCGHSAGAHLCAMMMTLDWSNHTIPNMIKGICCISGLFDLLPVMNIAVNDELKMTKECAERNSPQKILQCKAPTLPNCKVVHAAIGEWESPAFHKQSLEFIKTLKHNGIKSSLVNIGREDHFSVVEKLGEPDFLLSKLLCEMMSESDDQRKI